MTPLGTTYHVVAGTADTPPAIPGSVVTYRVRPRYEPQQWSNEVVIGYSRSGLAASIGVGGSGQASKEKHGWKNREPVLTQGEREALEKAEREAREKAEREALEKAEREAREKLEREAREKAEREAREKLEREALEKTEPPPSSPVVSALPTGPAAPAGGWHVVFADAFGAKIGAGVGEDKLWAKPNVNEPAEEGNDLNVYEPQQVRVGPEGLELVAHHEPNVGGTGKNYESGAVYTLGGRFTLHSYSGATFAVECVCKWPRNGGAADPAFWHDGSEGGPEQEVDDFEGFGWNSDGSKEWGVAIPALVGLGGHTVYHTEGAVKNFGFDPTLGFHRYTTVIGPGAAGKTKATEYIDGVLKWSFEVTTPTSSSGQHLILSYALREYPERVLPEDTRFAIRSVAVYQDGNHLGKFVTGGGVASGTIVK